METITKTIKLYRFNELNEAAQDTAKANFSETHEFFYGDDMLASLKEFCKTFGIDLRDYSLGYGRSYINTRFNLDSDVEDLTGIRAIKWLINNHYEDVCEAKMYYKGKKQRESRIFTQTANPTGVCSDFDLFGVLSDYMNYQEFDKNNTIQDIFEACFENFLNEYRKAFDYEYSSESIIANIEINDMYFTEEGKIY